MQAVIVSAQRSGGLWLAGCLSNHPDIHCPREEPFRRESIWQQKLGLNLKPMALLDFVLSEPYYQVSMCRLTYDQAFHPDVRKYVLRRQVRMIHLVRGVMSTVTSTLLAKQEMAKGVPRHSFNDDVEKFVDDEVLDVEPGEVVRRIQHLLGQRRKFAEFYADAPQLLVRYEELVLVGGGVLAPPEARRIAEFLEVPVRRLEARNRKMHRRPLDTYYADWAAVEAAIRARDWGGIDVWS